MLDENVALEDEADEVEEEYEDDEVDEDEDDDDYDEDAPADAIDAYLGGQPCLTILEPGLVNDTARSAWVSAAVLWDRKVSEALRKFCIPADCQLLSLKVRNFKCVRRPCHQDLLQNFAL